MATWMLQVVITLTLVMWSVVLVVASLALLNWAAEVLCGITRLKEALRDFLFYRNKCTCGAYDGFADRRRNG
jgi:hypothetical protein